MFFFIADTHFGHGAIIDLCHRPFKCVEEKEKRGSLSETMTAVG